MPHYRRGRCCRRPRSRQSQFRLSRGAAVLERLESRQLLATVWQNPIDSLDVDGDRSVAPRDALWVINDLIQAGSRLLPGVKPADAAYVDVDGDGHVAPRDALTLINFFNLSNQSPRWLREDLDSTARETQVIIRLGQDAGSRTYRVGIDAELAPGGGGFSGADALEILLVDPADPSRVLLDGGSPGSPLFRLTRDRADFGPGVIGWDGSELTLDVTRLRSTASGLLVFRLVDHDGGRGSRVSIQPLGNDVDPAGRSSSSYPLDESPPEGEYAAVDIAAGPSFSAFAQWGDVPIDGQHESRDVIHVRREDFDFAWGGVILGVVTQNAQGSSLDPGAASITELGDGRARTLLRQSQSAGYADSLALVRFDEGDFQVTWSADQGTTGAGEMKMFLAGDADGDHAVDLADLSLIRSKIGVSSGTPGYLIDADVNRDGQISLIDALFAGLNLGAATRIRPLVATASLSPDSDPDGNGVVLIPRVSVTGQTLPAASVTAVTLQGTDPTAHPAVVTPVNAQGRFSFETDLIAGRNLVELTASDQFGQRVTIERPISLGDVVLDFNASMLNVIRDWTTLSNDPYSNRVVTERPPVAARNLAMVHAAMFDAVNGIVGDYEPYLVTEAAPAGADPVAAAAAAAQRVASRLYTLPDERAVFDAALVEALATVPDGEGETVGVAWGRSVGDRILADRSNDGARAVVPYTPGTDPGDWQRTFPDFLPPLLPQWPNVKPFAMSSPSQFRAAPPPALDSAEYAAALNDVLAYGRVDSSVRTEDETNLALFWSDGGGTFTPPGHWNQIAADVAMQHGNSLIENARLFALLDLAEADAGISSWDTKYTFNLWRPIDAVRRGDTDGNPATDADPAWTPLLKTPPFPTYTSGHSTFSGAADIVLTEFFGDGVAFSSQADGHNGFRQRPLAAQQVTTRSFANFTEAANEAGRSRILGGIHFEFDNQAGLAAGRGIGRWVMDNFLRPR